MKALIADFYQIYFSLQFSNARLKDCLSLMHFQ
jgi:hypothetical protein